MISSKLWPVQRSSSSGFSTFCSIGDWSKGQLLMWPFAKWNAQNWMSNEMLTCEVQLIWNAALPLSFNVSLKLTFFIWFILRWRDAFPENSKRSNCPFFDSFSATNAQIDLDGFSTVRALEIRMKTSSISRIQHRETRRRSPTRRSHQPASGAPSWWPRWSNSGIGQVGALMGKMICLPISCGQYPKARSFCIWFILRWSDTQPFSNLCDFGLDVLQLIFDSFS